MKISYMWIAGMGEEILIITGVDFLENLKLVKKTSTKFRRQID